MFLGSKSDNHSVLKLDCGDGCVTINLLRTISLPWVNCMIHEYSVKLYEVYNQETNSNEGANSAGLSSAVGTLRREGE